MVINDYQNVLEKEWIAKLRKKYTVKVNEAIIKEILR
jgi:peptidyl-prolyl cis-trans isomerase SurA